MPKTKPGKYSIILLILMPLLFALGRLFMNAFYESVSSGDTILEDISKRPVLALTMLSGMASGVSSFVVGIVAIVKNKEHSPFVYFATIIGALFTLFLTAELQTLS